MKLGYKILISLAIGFWLLPAFNSALLSPASRQPTAQTAASAGPSRSAVVVVTPLARPPVIPAVNTAAFACNLSATSTPTFVQDQLALNPNQPASCFTVTAGTAVAQSRLAIAQLHPEVTVTVDARPAPLFLPYELSSSRSDAALPALPLPAAGLIETMVGVIMLAAASGSARKLKSQYRNLILLSQLKMLRC